MTTENDTSLQIVHENQLGKEYGLVSLPKEISEYKIFGVPLCVAKVKRFFKESCELPGDLNFLKPYEFDDSQLNPRPNKSGNDSDLEKTVIFLSGADFTEQVKTVSKFMNNVISLTDGLIQWNSIRYDIKNQSYKLFNSNQFSVEIDIIPPKFENASGNETKVKKVSAGYLKCPENLISDRTHKLFLSYLNSLIDGIEPYLSLPPEIIDRDLAFQKPSILQRFAPWLTRPLKK